MTLLLQEIGVVRVTRLSRDEFTMGNIHSYTKKEKGTAHDIENMVNRWGFRYPRQKTNQVSSFDTTLKQQKFAFLKGFFPLMREKPRCLDKSWGAFKRQHIP